MFNTRLLKFNSVKRIGAYSLRIEEPLVSLETMDAFV